MLTALLATAGVYLGYTRWTASPAETAIQDYFAALADGDAAKALSHVDLPAGFDISRYPLLTEPALADAGNRPKDLEIGSDGTQTFDVTFTAGGSPVRQRIAVVRNGDRYLLTNPFVVLAVSGDRNRQLIVNGVAVTPGDNTAFPSAYRVVAAGNRLFAESSITVTPGGNGRSAKAAFDTPALADGAQASIQDAVRVKLDQCAAAAADRTPHCPFWLRVPGYHPYVRWLIVDYPELTVGVASSVRFSSRSRGTVAWQLSFTSSYGQVVEKSGTLTFPVNGTATPATSGIDVVIDET
uniref:hypothetical protein n=1 Tax=Paractinoplanes polyasparticus TaxID=2856853 RepID=UPI001C84ADEF|nr:hypothetical protein [Actinoplanes polyasparticus]